MDNTTFPKVGADLSAETIKPHLPAKLRQMHEESLRLLENRMRDQERWKREQEARAKLDEEYRRQTPDQDSIFTTHPDLPAPARRAYLERLLGPYLTSSKKRYARGGGQ
jgi:hypothetical protein